MLITVPANLIKRSKTHFHFLPIGVDALVGVNGMIWIRKHTPDLQAAEVEADESLLYSNDNLVCIFY
jgi:exosome complex component RRP4